MQQDATSRSISFVKMHGAGNDFVVLDSRGRSAIANPVLAAALGDRHRGVGFDQLAEIRDDGEADIGLDFWNADGSRAGACGNATRCVASLIMDETGKTELSIRTARGVLRAHRQADGRVWVNMGQPLQEWREIPLARDVDPAHLPIEGDPVAVGMGNPHCVFFVDDVSGVDVAARGAEIEHHPLFPEATNVEFAEVKSAQDIRMRVWERGTGITLACGSGACATAVAARVRGLAGESVRIHADGGVLETDWRRDGIWMTGPVARVFDGELHGSFLGSLE